MTLQLARMGSYFAGGRVLEVTGEPVRRLAMSPTSPVRELDPNGRFAIEQAYVQYFEPEDADPLPFLLIHGGGQTGACWETTPDGRPGYLELLLRRGFAVHVADMMERGRAGFVPFEGVWPGRPVLRSAEEAWWLFRFGRKDGFPDRPFPGQRFPIHSFNAFMKQNVPRWTGNQEAAYAAFREIVRKIGPCRVMTHSSGGFYGYRLAYDEPDLVRALINLEPGAVPAEASADLSGRVFLDVMGDWLDSSQYWIDIDERIRANNARIAAAGADARYVRLADIGLPHFSHMIMMDEGHEQVLDWVLDAIGARFSGARP